MLPMQGPWFHPWSGNWTPQATPESLWPETGEPSPHNWDPV